MTGLVSESFWKRFSGAALATSGKASTDVEAYYVAVSRLLEDVRRPAEQWVWFDRVDPYLTLKTAAVNLLLLYDEIAPQGFVPPPLDFDTDGIGFLERHSQFLKSIAGFVDDDQRTLH